MDDIFEFRWEVVQGGYEWKILPGEKGENFILTSGVPFNRKYPRKLYFPLQEEKGLFRTFADVKPDSEEVKAFAIRYGLLGAHEELIDIPEALPEEEGPLKHYPGVGERLSGWLDEIFAMRSTLMLWDMVQWEDRKGLARYIQWKKGTQAHGTVVQYYSHPNLSRRDTLPYGENHVVSVIAGEKTSPELFARLRPGDVIQPALFYVQRTINEHLEGEVSPRLLWNLKRTHLGLYLMPGSLLGALWLQFAQAVDGDKDYRRCKQCNKWFEVSSQAARKSQLFCSNACRSKNYREKQEEARRLHAQGVPLKDIAERLKTEVDVAAGWVGLGA